MLSACLDDLPVRGRDRPVVAEPELAGIEDETPKPECDNKREREISSGVRMDGNSLANRSRERSVGACGRGTEGNGADGKRERGSGAGSACHHLGDAAPNRSRERSVGACGRGTDGNGADGKRERGSGAGQPHNFGADSVQSGVKSTLPSSQLVRNRAKCVSEIFVQCRER